MTSLLSLLKYRTMSERIDILFSEWAKRNKEMKRKSIFSPIDLQRIKRLKIPFDVIEREINGALSGKNKCKFDIPENAVIAKFFFRLENGQKGELTIAILISGGNILQVEMFPENPPRKEIKKKHLLIIK